MTLLSGSKKLAPIMTLLAVFVIGVVAVVIIFNGVRELKNTMLLTSNEQVVNLSQALAKQEGEQLRQLLEQNTESVDLQSAVDQFMALHPKIVAKAELYNVKGEKVATAENPILLSHNPPVENILLTLFTAAQKDQPKTVAGFFNVTLARAYMPQTLQQVDRNMSFLYAQELILLLLGVLLCGAFFALRQIIRSK